MLVKLENGRDTAHISMDAVTMAWNSGSRYAVKFGKEDVLHVDKESYEKVVEWLDWGDDLDNAVLPAIKISKENAELCEQLRNVYGLKVFGFSLTDSSDWTWHDVALEMAERIERGAIEHECRV